MICPKCKKELKDGVKFCGYCGKKFSSASSSVPSNNFDAQLNIAAAVSAQRISNSTVSSAPAETNVAKCPKCGSTSLQAKTKGVSVGKAAIGALLVGPVGLLAGGIGMNDAKIVCLNCGYEFEPRG
ncbi:MAG: zinc ribbon domain-containing protein [Oscillospiraceae bacterium]|nr:zinc ribbon domain-containing protein [Oscillospiraceae bacterium]